MVSPRNLADRMSSRRWKGGDDGFVRLSFTLPLEQARAEAREQLRQFPSQAYMTSVERWRRLPNGDIEFTMKRLKSAD